jgi:hypothetical protein
VAQNLSSRRCEVSMTSPFHMTFLPSPFVMDLDDYIAFLNDAIDVGYGVMWLPNGSITVMDRYRNVHTLTPQTQALLRPALRAAIGHSGSMPAAREFDRES